MTSFLSQKTIPPAFFFARSISVFGVFYYFFTKPFLHDNSYPMFMISGHAIYNIFQVEVFVNKSFRNASRRQRNKQTNLVGVYSNQWMIRSVSSGYPAIKETSFVYQDKIKKSCKLILLLLFTAVWISGLDGRACTNRQD